MWRYRFSQSFYGRRWALCLALFVMLCGFFCGVRVGSSGAYGGWVACIAPLPAKGILPMLLAEVCVWIWVLAAFLCPALSPTCLLSLFALPFEISLVQKTLLLPLAFFPRVLLLLCRLPRHLLALPACLWVCAGLLTKRNRPAFVEWFLCVVLSLFSALLDVWICSAI